MYVKRVFVQISFIVAFIFGRLCSRIVFNCYLSIYLSNRIEVDRFAVVMESLICVIRQLMHSVILTTVTVAHLSLGLEHLVFYRPASKK